MYTLQSMTQGCARNNRRIKSNATGNRRSADGGDDAYDLLRSRFDSSVREKYGDVRWKDGGHSIRYVADVDYKGGRVNHSPR